MVVEAAGSRQLCCYSRYKLQCCTCGFLKKLSRRSQDFSWMLLESAMYKKRHLKLNAKGLTGGDQLTLPGKTAPDP